MKANQASFLWLQLSVLSITEHATATIRGRKMTPPQPSTVESAPSPADDEWVHVPTLEDIFFKMGGSAARHNGGMVDFWRHRALQVHAIVKAAWSDRRRRRFVKVFVIGAAGSFIFSFIFGLICSRVVERLHTVQFDPYAVLLIDQGTDLVGIRRAYRRLSITYHPDKISPPDHSSYNRMVMAYHVLTADESCRDDYTQAHCWADFSAEATCVDACGGRGRCGCEIWKPPVHAVARLALTMCARFGLASTATSWRLAAECAGRSNHDDYDSIRGFKKQGMSMVDVLSRDDPVPKPDVLYYLR